MDLSPKSLSDNAIEHLLNGVLRTDNGSLGKHGVSVLRDALIDKGFIVPDDDAPKLIFLWVREARQGTPLEKEVTFDFKKLSENIARGFDGVGLRFGLDLRMSFALRYAMAVGLLRGAIRENPEIQEIGVLLESMVERITEHILEGCSPGWPLTAPASPPHRHADLRRVLAVDIYSEHFSVRRVSARVLAGVAFILEGVLVEGAHVHPNVMWIQLSLTRSLAAILSGMSPKGQKTELTKCSVGWVDYDSTTDGAVRTVQVCFGRHTTEKEPLSERDTSEDQSSPEVGVKS